MTPWTRSSAAVALGVLLCACSATETTVRPTPSLPARHTIEPGLPWPALTAAPVAPVRRDQMQKELERWVSTGLLPGVTAAVVGPVGTWSGAAGKDGMGTPLRPDTGMALASITKTFVAAEVMALAEQGKLDLDARAATYVRVPWVANGVTVRQLLGHRSGMRPGPDDAYADLYSKPAQRWSPERFLGTFPVPTGPPGQRFEYVNGNYTLLGLLVAKVSGTTTAEALHRDLLLPLGLTRVAYQDDEALPPPVAAHGVDGDLAAPTRAETYVPFRSVASAAGAAGGMAADAASVARWGYALYGAQRLKPASVDQMTDFSDGDGYGLGTFDFTADYWQNFGMDGFGHVGEIDGFRTVLVVLPEHQLSIAILSPSSTQTHPLVRQLVAAGSLLAD
ncbi:serine hydrolase domain-containing protein [Knoellia sp. LjRoot47]|uniref:serine hydrolase domain-containing protein n=1 Tax=Knoellia sp. LjRoot47 TaxID=3342330 RepID=UPI003ECE2487